MERVHAIGTANVGVRTGLLRGCKGVERELDEVESYVHSLLVDSNMTVYGQEFVVLSR